MDCIINVIVNAHAVFTNKHAFQQKRLNGAFSMSEQILS